MSATTVLDQTTVPFTGGNLCEIVTQSIAVSGGTLYQAIMSSGVPGTQPLGIDQTFVPAAAGGIARYLSLVHARGDSGIALTASAGSGNMGIARTAGTSLALVGEATSSSGVTDKAIFEFNLPDSYVAGSNIAVTVNAIITGSGTLTAASTTLTVTPYTEVNGVETAVTVSAAVQVTKTGGNLTFTITGTGLTPGAHLVLELVLLVTTSAGACTGQINSVSYVA